MGVYHDGRCGAQKWGRWILWMDLGEPDYDEFDIERRWNRAHAGACEHIWIAGPLQPEPAGEYWPALHLAIAEGADIDRIRHLLQSDPDAARRTDRLGRTPLHWAAIYPVPGHRAELSRMLADAGADPGRRDADGLAPADWEARAR
jgi:hypothetical protein